MQNTKDQHTVPKCYLKNFSPDGKRIFQKFKRVDSLAVLRNKELKRPISLKSATVVENFYTLADSNNDMLIESDFYANFIENEYSEVYDLLVNPKIDKFDMDQRRKLINFFISLHVRTPKQFEVFFNTVPESYKYEIEKIKEDYKLAHVKDVFRNAVIAHEFKVVHIFRLIDNSEFITSDNPVLFVNRFGALVSNYFEEQFNIDNKIFIPIDKKHCCILSEGSDVNGISFREKCFYNKVVRKDVNVDFASQVNLMMFDNAHKFLFGSEFFLTALFKLFKFT